MNTFYTPVKLASAVLAATVTFGAAPTVTTQVAAPAKGSTASTLANPQGIRLMADTDGTPVAVLDGFGNWPAPRFEVVCGDGYDCVTITYPNAGILVDPDAMAKKLSDWVQEKGESEPLVVYYAYSMGTDIVMKFWALRGRNELPKALTQEFAFMVGAPSTPSIGISAIPDWKSPVPTTWATNFYDPVGNFPTKGWLRPFTLLNMVLGFVTDHMDYSKFDIANPGNLVGFTSENDTVVIGEKGDTPFSRVFLWPLKLVGLDGLYDALDELATKWLAQSYPDYEKLGFQVQDPGSETEQPQNAAPEARSMVATTADEQSNQPEAIEQAQTPKVQSLSVDVATDKVDPVQQPEPPKSDVTVEPQVTATIQDESGGNVGTEVSDNELEDPSGNVTDTNDDGSVDNGNDVDNASEGDDAEGTSNSSVTNVSNSEDTDNTGANDKSDKESSDTGANTSPSDNTPSSKAGGNTDNGGTDGGSDNGGKTGGDNSDK